MAQNIGFTTENSRDEQLGNLITDIVGDDVEVKFNAFKEEYQDAKANDAFLKLTREILTNP